jgi:hypothetical protein
MRETIGALKELERFWEVALDAFKRYAEKKMIIRKSIRVEQPQPITCRIFCGEIGQWWPKGPSFNGKPLAEMVIEGRVGGRFYERYVDGTEYERSAGSPPISRLKWSPSRGARRAGSSIPR